MTVIHKALGLTAAAAILACAAPVAAQDTNADPNYGTMSLSAGFPNDPRVVSLRAGGDIPASNAASGCSGFITNAPDVRLNYTGGTGVLPLIISVDSGSDTTLIVNAPDGRWYCDDDGGVNGMNPAVRFNNPRGGRYEIWVGTYRAGSSQPARLYVSEVSSQ
ncbi:peptidase S1 [Brevundimonas sp. 2R-24]|uniref:Peptidase S1 n=1 Tax=Peiella sedimenti TaxID=3061083 RepID=A0ABT8SM76_9CAUL|nr:peptidase S1 [Caulobacteraceae bacterium XZ-24]